MTPLTAVLLLAAVPARLPDGKAPDAVTFAFGHPFGPRGTLTVTSAGKVGYREVLNPPMGAADRVHAAEWDIPKAEAAALLAGLVGDGLLDLPARVRHTPDTRFTVASGRWRMYLHADPVPEKLMARLLPLLEKAHPARWKPKPAPAADEPAVTAFEWTLVEKPGGPEVLFRLARHGTASYFRKRAANDPEGAGNDVSEVWSVGAKEAAALLDALAAAGALDLADGDGRYPSHHVQAFAGKWTLESHPKEMPDAVLKLLRPLFEHADPAHWKKP
ncbi:MAG: hypothetical protein C0501_10420 [Isosphaera sp.]|nr:hypothetical protein [Isosphaera sp.]